jgi:nitroimidazol reductase NimA-like FMN-containing flavoprotein (pyridoxamine 5'-phosphate oxidase superfamily)
MTFPTREITDAEIEEFLTENDSGILCFAGEEPYCIPMGCKYRKGTVILGFSKGGKKWDCIQKGSKVCFTVCRPRKTTPDLSESCTTVIFEGELEKLTDRVYYGLSPLPGSVDVVPFVIKVNKLSTRKCLQEPCELLAGG